MKNIDDPRGKFVSGKKFEPNANISISCSEKKYYGNMDVLIDGGSRYINVDVF